MAVQSDRDGIRACMAVIQCQNPRQVHGKVAGRLCAALRGLRPTLQVGWCWQVGMSSDAWLGVSSVCWLSSTFGQGGGEASPCSLTAVRSRARRRCSCAAARRRQPGWACGGPCMAARQVHAVSEGAAKDTTRKGMHCCSGGLPSCCSRPADRARWLCDIRKHYWPITLRGSAKGERRKAAGSTHLR